MNLKSDPDTIVKLSIITKTNSDKLMKILGRDLTASLKRGIPKKKVGMSYTHFYNFSIFKKHMSPSLEIEVYQSAGNIKRAVKSDLLKRYIIKFDF